MNEGKIEGGSEGSKEGRKVGKKDGRKEGGREALLSGQFQTSRFIEPRKYRLTVFVLRVQKLQHKHRKQTKTICLLMKKENRK